MAKTIQYGVSNAMIEVEASEIESLPAEVLEQLDCGDVIIKRTGKQKHLYRVSYKGDGVGEGLCFTYIDASCVETISYDKKATGWEFNSKDITPLGA